MEKINNLEGKSAVEKIQAILINNPTCMLVSSLEMSSPSVCPMTVKTLDDDGAIWFLSNKKSEHYQNIQNDSRVLLTFANNTDKEYLSVSGNGIHFDTKQVINELWDEQDAQWYTDGRQSDDIVALKVIIKDAYYWDTVKQKSISVND